MKPHIHAQHSVTKFGGKASDYKHIHEFIDCSKGTISDHRHRALTHNTWFISFVLPQVFGETIINSDNKEVSIRDIGEQHVLEDFRGKFIPSAQDFLMFMSYESWMNNGNGEPPSSPKAPKDLPEITINPQNKPYKLPIDDITSPFPYEKPPNPLWPGNQTID
jgi:hypothetical protein